MFANSQFHNIPEFTVSEISQKLKKTVEEAFPYVKIRGEISGFKKASSGHVYFSLKDESSVLNAICWKGTAQNLSFVLEDGLEVVCLGKITTYQARSNYQIIVEFMEPAGLGALMALLEKRKQELAKKGFFDQDKKKSLPFLPERIGVVTSPTGAVIKDILHRIEERFPLHVMLWPVAVQGEGAAEQIAAAIKAFNELPEAKKPQVIIVARGGGSTEDLWAFNEEIVVKAVFDSVIPIISAIGHETDTTLIDYAADVRAPTPTAAAEFAVPVKEELTLLITDLARRMQLSLVRFLEDRAQYLQATARSIPSIDKILTDKIQRLDDIETRLIRSLPMLLQIKQQQLSIVFAGLKKPNDLIEKYQQKLTWLEDKNNTAITNFVLHMQNKLQLSARLLASCNYKNVLNRGYAIVRHNKKIITKANAMPINKMLQIEFADGKKNVIAQETAKKPDNKKTNNTNKQSSFL